MDHFVILLISILVKFSTSATVASVFDCKIIYILLVTCSDLLQDKRFRQHNPKSLSQQQCYKQQNVRNAF